MTTISTTVRDWLNTAKHRYNDSDPQFATAACLIGLFEAILEEGDRQDREDTLTRLHDEADAALGRLLDLAEWHETKAQKAIDFPGGPENVARMAKAAEVHKDAAQRIRDAIDGGGAEPQEEESA